ncbi:MAG: response regulator, partial [Myxococcaceae bacterium]
MEETPARILMVDDHPANLLALEGILSPLGQELVRATTGADALKAVLQQDFAVILMDVQMPGMDGFQTAKLIKEREKSRSIPIIFLTALSRDAANVFKGYKHGAVDYLLKPFDAEILRAKVQVFVELHQKNEKLKRQEFLLRERELEAMERRSDLRFQTLTESIPQCIWAATADGTGHYANRRALELVGDPFSTFTSSVPEDVRAEYEASFAKARQSGGTFEREVPLLRKGESEPRWHIVRAVPERDDQRRVVGWFVTADDVDDLKRTEAALKVASESKDLFLAAASHELRTPLQAAKGHTHLALKKLGDSAELQPLKKSVVTISRQIDRMAKLVEDLLDISRLQAGRLQLEMEEFDVVPMLRETVERVQGVSTDHQLSLQAPDELRVRADRSRLEQVVTNLLSNAIRYSPRGGPVQVTAAENDGE